MPLAFAAIAILGFVLVLAPKPVFAEKVAVERLEPTDIEVLFYSGIAQYGNGDFGGAALAFQQALLINKHPDLVYNIARSHEKAGNKKAAIAWYEVYERGQPIDSSAILQRIAALKTERQAVAALDVPSSDASSSDAPSEQPSEPLLPMAELERPVSSFWPANRLFYGAASLGASGLLTGLVFAGLSVGTESDAKGRDGAERARLERIAETQKGVGVLGLFVGAVGLGAASWIWFDGRRSNSRGTVRVGAVVQGRSAALIGEF